MHDSSMARLELYELVARSLQALSQSDVEDGGTYYIKINLNSAYLGFSHNSSQIPLLICIKFARRDLLDGMKPRKETGVCVGGEEGEQSEIPP